MHTELPVFVVIGNPRLECARMGICSLLEESAGLHLSPARHARYRMAPANIAVGARDEMLFVFPKKNMLPLTARMFFSKKTFLLEVPKFIPDFICRELHLDPFSILLPGLWPLENEESNYRVRIGIRADNCPGKNVNNCLIAPILVTLPAK